MRSEKNIEFYAKKLANLIRKSVENVEKCALAFSGGLDSGILAFLLDNCTLYTVGIRNSVDVKRAKKFSYQLGRNLKIIEIDENVVIESAKFLLENFGEMSIVEISFEIPLMLVAKNSLENTIVTGQGADELFGGYKKYLSDPSIMKEDLDKLFNVTYTREVKIAKHFGKNLFCPYLNEKIVNFAEKIPTEYKIMDGERKYVLRLAAKYLGVPESIYSAEKKAAQYGSGVMKILRKIARRYRVKLGELPKIIVE